MFSIPFTRVRRSNSVGRQVFFPSSQVCPAHKHTNSFTFLAKDVPARLIPGLARLPLPSPLPPSPPDTFLLGLNLKPSSPSFFSTPASQPLDSPVVLSLSLSHSIHTTPSPSQPHFLPTFLPLTLVHFSSLPSSIASLHSLHITLSPSTFIHPSINTSSFFHH